MRMRAVAGLRAWGGARAAAPGSTIARILLGAAFLAAAACGGGPAGPSDLPTPQPTPTPSPKAVVISIDGLRPDAFTTAAGASAPNIVGLSRRGAYTWSAQTIVPAMTLPAHSSMLSGVPPTVHGLTWDDWRPDKGCITVPTVFGIARAAGLRTVMVVGKEKFRQIEAPDTVSSFVLATGGDADVANQAIVQVQAGFDLMFVHFPDTDLTGHARGWMSAPYLAKVTEADHAVGRLLSALPPETTVILSADHGGHSNTHGLPMPEDMTIPWVIAGPRVSGGRELQRPVRTVDTAATALYVLGLSLPSNVSGIVVAEAFTPR